MVLRSSPWATCLRRRLGAALRLFCFPCAGAGATIFRQWAEQVPETIEVWPIHLAGRERRIADEPIANMLNLADALCEVMGGLLQLTAVIVAHDGLRVPVLRHHLHLTVGKPAVKRPRDGCPPEVVRREVFEPGVVSSSLDDLLHHPRRERLVEFERPVVRVWLEQIGVLLARVRDFPPLSI